MANLKLYRKVRSLRDNPTRLNWCRAAVRCLRCRGYHQCLRQHKRRVAGTLFCEQHAKMRERELCICRETAHGKGKGECPVHGRPAQAEKHKRQHGPISAACDCHCCQTYSLAYVHHLFEVGDPLGLRLATVHNLRFYTQLMERIGEL